MNETHDLNLKSKPFLTRQESLLLLSVALFGLAIVLIVAIYLLVSGSQGVPVEFGVYWEGADTSVYTPLGGGQANDASLHNGIDLISGGDAPHWLKGTTGPENTRDVYAPVTGTVKEKFGSTVTIQQIEYNGSIIEGLEVRLTHVAIKNVPTQMTAGSGPITGYGTHGTTLPHLHISVILYYEDFSQSRISRDYSGEAVYYDPRSLLQEYGPIDYVYQ